jgi:hypothetical protein
MPRASPESTKAAGTAEKRIVVVIVEFKELW